MVNSRSNLLIIKLLPQRGTLRWLTRCVETSEKHRLKRRWNVLKHCVRLFCNVWKCINNASCVATAISVATFKSVATAPVALRRNATPRSNTKGVATSKSFVTSRDVSNSESVTTSNLTPVTSKVMQHFWRCFNI